MITWPERNRRLAHRTAIVRALRPRIDRDEAVEAFTRGLGGAMRRVALGPVRSVADVYVPFHLFRVAVARPAGDERMVLGIDAVTATLDLYRFDDPPQSRDVIHVHTRNHVTATVSPTAAHDAIVARLRRIIYQRAGFFAGGRCHLDVRAIDDEISVPYWVGFFGRRDEASIVVMDGVRRQIEGGKMRRLIASWLAE